MTFTKEQRAAYDKGRKRSGASGAHKVKSRPARSKATMEERGGNLQSFCSIDSEGYSFGPELVASIDGKEKTYKDHGTFLWLARRHDPDACCELSTRELNKPLKCLEILEFLTALPSEFPKCIFVSFAFGYDANQIFKHFSREQKWEIQNERPYSERENPNWKAPRAHYRHKTKYEHFGINYMKGKSLYIRNYKTRTGVKIFDTFSYFQSSFLKACGNMPIPKEDMELIEQGKIARLDFTPADLDFARAYTMAECRALNIIMNEIRKGTRAIGLKPRAWHGPGALSSNAMAQHGVHEHYEKMYKDGDIFQQPYQVAAHHAYFGANIQLMKMGVGERCFSYDIHSAYPAILCDLPSMQNGSWIKHDSLTREQIAAFSKLSIIRLRTYCDTQGLAPFYPFPYRDRKGAIYFPSKVHGWYMQEEVLAGFDYFDAKVEKRAYCNWRIELLEGWEFIPDPAQPKPFAFLREFYFERQKIPKTDSRNQVIKLIINSSYGKTAQGIGSEIPKDACIWYAAATTAGTRAQLMRAMILKPHAIVAAMTDGIISTEPLVLPITKNLGDWEADEISGVIMVKSGIYDYIEKGDHMPKARGVKKTNLTMTVPEWLQSVIRNAWRNDQANVSYPYTQYITLGQAVTSPTLNKLHGCWVTGSREINIRNIGTKRGWQNRKQNPYDEFQDSRPANIFFADENGDMALSARSEPEWLVEEMEMERMENVDDRDLAISLQ